MSYLERIKREVNGYCDTNFRCAFDPKNPSVKLHEASFGADEINAMIAQMLSGMVTMGKEVRCFEEECAAYFNSGYSLMCNSGSSANLLALAALCNPAWNDPIQPGDEVIVPALSWSTTVWPILQHQLVPVFVDCNPDTFNIVIQAIEAAITPRTRAIMPVHVYGNPCQMAELMALAAAHDLYVIEDACEAMGTRYLGKPVGSFGDLATMSLYYSHHITTFEGGLCFTGNYELMELLRVLRAHGWSRETDQHAKHQQENPGIDPRFIFINTGYNLRPTEVQAAMGLQQLPKLANFVEKRRAVHAHFTHALQPYSNYLHVQQEQKGGESSWLGLAIVIDERAPFTRHELTTRLQERCIETRPIIAGNLTRHPVMRMHTHRISGILKNADAIMDRGFAIGCHPSIDIAAQHYVVECIDTFMKEWL